MVARAHKTLIWERTRHTQRLRYALREYFPAALEAFDDLDAAGHPRTARQGPRPGRGGEADPHPDQRRAETRPPPRHRHASHPHPGRAAQPSSSAAGRWSPPPTRPPPAHAAVLTTLNEQINTLQGQVEAAFWPAPGR